MNSRKIGSAKRGNSNLLHTSMDITIREYVRGEWGVEFVWDESKINGSVQGKLNRTTLEALRATYAYEQVPIDLLKRHCSWELNIQVQWMCLRPWMCFSRYLALLSPCPGKKDRSTVWHRGFELSFMKSEGRKLLSLAPRGNRNFTRKTERRVGLTIPRAKVK